MPLSRQLAGRLLRAMQGELETNIERNLPIDPVMLASHLAMVCQILREVVEEGSED